MGFFNDVSDLRRAIKTKVDEGRGSRSLIEALDEQQTGSQPPASKPKRSHGKTFLLSALAGALWQGTRRR